MRVKVKIPVLVKPEIGRGNYMASVVKISDWKGWSAVTIGSDLSHLEELYTLSETISSNKLEEFEKELELKTKHFSEEDKAEYGDFMSDEYWKLNEVFPQIFRTSILITCLSRLEHHLKDICKSIYKYENSYAEPEKLEQDTIVNCKKYLINNAKFSNEVFNREWGNILCYKTIRNSFTHNNGYVRETKKIQIESFFSKNKNLGALKDHRIQLYSSFCIQVIKDINTQLLNIDKYMRAHEIKTHLSHMFG